MLNVQLVKNKISMLKKRLMPKDQWGPHDNDATNAAYLAALLDLKAFSARRDHIGKVVHVGIKFTTTAKWAKEAWPRLKETYHIEAEITSPDQTGKSVINNKVGRPNREQAYEFYVRDPASVKKLLVIARPYMERQAEADSVIAACDELLREGGSA